MRTTLTFFTILLLGVRLFAQTPPADTMQAAPDPGSAKAVSAAPLPTTPVIADTAATAVSGADSAGDSSALTATPSVIGQGDSTLDSTAADTARSAAIASALAPKPEAKKKIELIKRSYNGRQQVMLATGMMIFVVGMITAAQQWNPR